MVQSYSIGKKIYSVDMMFAYINIFKPKSTKVPVAKLVNALEYEGWGDPQEDIYYSAFDVLDNPRKYKKEMARIKKANLQYPIIMDKKFIIDGVHRLTKAYIERRKTINAYIFDSKLMRKFLIDSDGNWDKVDSLDVHYFIQLFVKRFC